MKAIDDLKELLRTNSGFYNIEHRVEWKNCDLDIKEMEGKTFDKVFCYKEALIFANDNEIYLLYHGQECCEDVTIDDVCGDLHDLEGTPLLKAEVVSYNNDDGLIGAKDTYDDSYTWTFYKFATRKGYVDVKWYGTSNGYYSESVDLCHFPIKDGQLIMEEHEETRNPISPDHPLYSIFGKVSFNVQFGDVTVHFPDNYNIE